MRFLRKNNIFIMISICLILLVSINLTYSKFTYSKEVNGSLVTVQQLPSLYETLASKSSTLDTNVVFFNYASSTNGQGLMKMSSTVNDTYPILYYRGDVTDNNVIYGGYCWLIVRTTETGGVKLLYNGEVNEDGSCNNYSGVGGVSANNASGVFATSAFNTNQNSPVYAGYMYNDETIYDLSTTAGVTAYKSHLADTSRLDGGTGRHTQNKTNSTIKGVIDSWYKSNIEGKPHENLLEDTVWCNDRSVNSEDIDNYSSNNKFAYLVELNTWEKPRMISLACPREVDSFTTSRDNGNGDLDYPIGLLTADEVDMAGSASHTMSMDIITYLNCSNCIYWLMSPANFGTYVQMFSFQTFTLSYLMCTAGFGIRPSVSLSLKAPVTGGNGSYETPYIIG